jgi:branched-chain amino acid transport system permease protein/urea transport system permease protein
VHRLVIGALLTQVVNGLSLASILILIALGLAVIFGLLGVINLAHADLFMAGMYAVVWMQGATGHFWLGVLAAPIVVGAVGLVVDRGVVRWLRDRPLETLLATLGVGIVIREGVKLLFGAGYRQVSNPMPGDIAIGPVAYPAYRLLLIAITIVILVGLAAWLYRTAAGLRLRAMLQDRDTAACYGIDPDRTSLIAFVVGSALAGLAGALMSPLVTVGPDVGIIYLARAFMVVVVGGVGSILGLVGGGIIIGGGDALAGYFLNPTIANAAVLILAIVILRFRPNGLFR